MNILSKIGDKDRFSSRDYIDQEEREVLAVHYSYRFYFDTNQKQTGNHSRCSGTTLCTRTE